MKQSIVKFFKIIRWKNVLIYALLQVLLYFALFDRNFSIKDGWLFLTLSIISFGMAGNIHNNILDYELDQKKKNFIPFNKTTYLIWVIVLLVFGFLFGFAAFYMTFSPTLLYSIFIIPVALALYNIYLKKLPLIGNLVIAFLIALSIYTPVAHSRDIHYDTKSFHFLIMMGFLFTLMREIIKDMEDMEVDRMFHYKTLPIVSRKAAYSLYGLLNILFFVFLFKHKESLNSFCFNTLLITGIISWIIATKLLKEKKYHQISLMIKFMMLIGFLAISLLG